MDFKSKIKEIFFTILIWVLFFVLLNFLSGLIIKNRYIAVDPVDEKSAETSWGYFSPNQEKIILFPGKKEYKVTINSLGLRSVGLGQDLSPDDIKNKYRVIALGRTRGFPVRAGIVYPGKNGVLASVRGRGVGKRGLESVGVSGRCVAGQDGARLAGPDTESVGNQRVLHL